MEKYSYSFDEEMFHDSYDSPEEAATEALANSEEDTVVWVGRNVAPPEPEQYFDIDDLIELVSCQDLYSGDYADGWYSGSREQEKEINEQVRELIRKWFDKHGLRPRFWLVEDVEEWISGDDGKPVRLTEYVAGDEGESDPTRDASQKGKRWTNY